MEREMVRFLQKCKSINQLKQIHLQILINGLEEDNFLLQNLITCSSDLISLDYAFSVLQTSNSPTVVAYNTMIKCFTGGRSSISTFNALSVYKSMRRRACLVSPNSFTFTFLLRCLEGLDSGRGLHGHILKMGLDVSSEFVGNTLLNFYAKCGSYGFDFACTVFDEMPERDVVSWNTMIGMHMDCGDVESAMGLFESMPKRSLVTWNSIISGLAKNGKMASARSVFERMPEKNEISWNSLISGYIKAGDLRSAEAVFDEMPVKSVVSCTAIISGYALNGDIESAKNMFDQMGTRRNLVTWNAMMAGYVNKSMFDEALSLFHLMLHDGKCIPNQITLISVLSAISHLGSLEHGKWINSYIKKKKINLWVPLGNALIDMFAKCGDVENANLVFHQMNERCLITWSTMVSGLAVNGMCEEAIAMFEKMIGEGIEPDDVIFIAVLSACNHGGLVEEGKRLFDQMVHEFRIKPQIKHYGCMVDLLARSGNLDEAIRFTKNMNFEPNSVIWATLISACKIHGNGELFKYVTKRVLEQEPLNPGYLTQIMNLSLSVGRTQDALGFRKAMRDQRIEKVPGCSSIQIGDSVHEFLARDTSHLRRIEVYKTLEFINGHLWSEYDLPDAIS